MECPFCGGNMGRGTVRARGRPTVWIADDSETDRLPLIDPFGLRSGGDAQVVGRLGRAASLCGRCEAVVVHPRPPDERAWSF